MSNTTPIFNSAFMKLARACHHIENLENVITQWQSEHSVDWTIEIVGKTESGEPQIHAHPDKPIVPPPAEISLIIGDAIHNIRSSLDHMATGIVLYRTGENKKVYFPFANTPEDLEKMIEMKRFHLAGDDCVNLLKTLKPYVGGNELLRSIHDLDIEDKHNTVHTIGVAGASPNFKFDYDANGEPKLTVFEETAAPYHVIFGGAGDDSFTSPPVIDFLKDAVRRVEGILKKFEALIGP